MDRVLSKQAIPVVHFALPKMRFARLAIRLAK